MLLSDEAISHLPESLGLSEIHFHLPRDSESKGYSSFLESLSSRGKQQALSANLAKYGLLLKVDLSLILTLRKRQ